MILGLIGLASPAVAGAGTPRALVGPRTDEIRQMLNGQVAAWNRGDLEGFLAAYWSSDTLTFFSGGEASHGWKAARKRYIGRYGPGSGNAMGQLQFQVYNVDLFDADHAMVRGGWRLVRGTAQGHGLFTLLLRRFQDVGWRIVHDHTSSG